jgi:uncharacterized protein YjdB
VKWISTGISAALAAMLGALGLVLACSGGPDKTAGPTGKVAAVTVSPDSATVVLGDTEAFAANPEDATGKTLTGITVIWASADTTIATVSRNGVVTAHRVGTVRIGASADGINGYAVLTVAPLPVASVTIGPNPASVPLNATATLTATLTDTHGDTLSNQTVTWTSSDTTTVTVTALSTQTQVVAGHKPGSATITATSSNGKSSTDVVTVSNPVNFILVTPNPLAVRAPYTVQSAGLAEDANGTVLTGTAFAWSTKSHGAIARVDSSTGIVTGVAPGFDSVYATAGGRRGGTPTTVLADSVRTITVTPSAATITVAQTETLTVSIADSLGTPPPGVAVTWSSVPGGRVSQTGIVTPHAADTTNGIAVTATAQGKSAQSAITVTHVPVGHVSVTPSPASVAVDSTITLTAALTDAAGGALANRPLNWQSSNPGVATVTGTAETGTVTGVAAGATVITATSPDGPAGTANVSVSDPLVFIVVTLSPDSLRTTYLGRATAQAQDVNHQPLGPVTVTWSTGNGGIASINGAGFVTGVAAGQTNVIATAQGTSTSGHASITILTDSVSNVTISGNTSIPYNATEQLTATLTDSTAKVLSGPAVTWSSVPTGRVDGSGVVTPHASDTTNGIQVTARSEGKSATVTVPVTHIPVSSITVALSPSSTARTGYTVQATATALDASNNPIPGVTFTWSTGNSGIASVGASSGVVTGVSAGQTNVIATARGTSTSGHTAVTVLADSVSSVSISGNNSITYNATEQLTATLTDSTGRVLTGLTVSWSSVPSGRVDGSGNVTPQPSDTTNGIQVTARSEGQSATVTVPITHIPVSSITVALNPSTLRASYAGQATATARDASNNPIPGVTFTWSSDNTGVASVGVSTGVVTGIATGHTNIVAHAEGTTGHAGITVLTDSVAGVAISGNNSISYNTTEQLSATLTDSTGKVLAGPAVAWSSNPPGRVDGNGVVTPQPSDTAAGVQVTATSEGQSTTVTVPVTVPPASSVSITPTPDSSALGGSAVTLTATAFDANNNPVSGTIFLTIGNSQIAQLSSGSVPSGNTFTVTPGGPNTGVTGVHASINGHIRTALFTVVPRDTISPQNLSLSQSGTSSGTLTVQMRNADGTFDTSSPATWTGDDGGAYVSFTTPSGNDGNGNSTTTVSVIGTPPTTNYPVNVTVTTSDGTATTQILINP